jgi:O-antigen/teichoic acid export membrane protein
MLSAVGLPSAAQRFMAEYLSRDEPGIAYRIFWACFKAQSVIVTIVVGIGLTLVWTLLPHEQFWIGFWLVSSIAPRMLGFIPSQINSAIEDMSRNIPAMLASNIATVVIVLSSVWLGWDMVGLAVAQFVGHTIDLLMKMYITSSNLREWKQTAPPALDPALKARLRTFAGQGLGLMVLNVLVWDRSDVLLLKYLSPDVGQVTFFSYSFTLVEKLLMVSQVVGMAMGLNVLTQFAKDRTRSVSMAVSSAFYLLLAGMPILIGAAALSQSLWAIYGPRFAAGVSVFVVMALLAIPRIVLAPAQALLQASEKQGFLVWWGCLCGVINVAVDFFLIPSHGAVGAAFGNGTAQAMAACGAWIYVARHFSADLKPWLLARVAVSAAAMGAIVAVVNRSLPPLPGAIAGLVVGVIAYPVMLRLTHALSEEDRERFMSLSKVFPPVLRDPFHRILWTVIPKTT